MHHHCAMACVFMGQDPANYILLYNVVSINILTSEMFMKLFLTFPYKYIAHIHNEIHFVNNNTCQMLTNPNENDAIKVTGKAVSRV